MIKNDIYLPDVMEKDREILEKTLKNKISIKTKKVDSSQSLPVFQSKFGGNPYFPTNMEYPKNKEGQPLAMLAQINFEELFTNQEILDAVENDDELKYLPRKGMLSFFVDYYDDLVGSNFGPGSDSSSFKVIYFDELTENHITDFSFLEPQSKDFYIVVDGEYEVSFEMKEQLITMESYEWEEIVGKEAYDYLEELDGDMDDIEEEYANLYTGGHQIGGYPFFTQDDGREWDDELKKYNFLLFQLDSECGDGKMIMWGDLGVGNFFINIEKLKNKDFTDIYYTWDCS